VAYTSACLGRGIARAPFGYAQGRLRSRSNPVVAGLLSLGALGCVEGGSLAISAGAPVEAAVQGSITDCGRPVSGAEVVLTVQQDEPDQARPVDEKLGPVTTGRDGKYIVEVAPAFAVPGPAEFQLRVTAPGVTAEVPGGTLRFSLGTPARDTLRLDIDLGAHRGFCLNR
jgi:hypothetical protein